MLSPILPKIVDNILNALIIPRPVKLIWRSGFVDMGAAPCLVTGASEALLASVNQSLASLPALNSNVAYELPDFRGRRPFQFSKDNPTRLFKKIADDDPIIEGSKAPLVVCHLKSGRTPNPENSGDYPRLKQHAYRLTINGVSEKSPQPMIQIDAESETGIRHALYTLVQLLRQFGRALPCLEIQDYPRFASRGFMLDISRDRVPTMNELRKLIDLLASIKINHLQLYTEHTFAYRGHESVWVDASPLTAEEVRELDERCLSRGITLAANQNCFGHLTRWLEKPKYQHLAETVGEWNFLHFKKKGAFSLCPTNPGSITLVNDMLEQLTPNFTSKLLNVGCDETFDVGQGKSQTAVQARGFFPICWAFVEKIFTKARALNRQPMFWADLLLREDTPVDLDIGNAVPMVWGYEPDMPWDKWLGRIKSLTDEYWVCPGTSSWNSITGRFSERIENLKQSTASGYANGATGVLLTEWGDFGHRQQFPIMANALAQGSQIAWEGHCYSETSKAISVHVFGDVNLGICRWLNFIGDADYQIRKIAGGVGVDGRAKAIQNRSFLFGEMELPLNKAGAEVDIKLLLETSEILRELTPMESNGVDSTLTHEIRHTWDVANWALEKALLRRDCKYIRRVNKAKLVEDMEKIIEEHRRLWLKRSRIGGLNDSCRYYQVILEDINNNV